MVSMDDDVICRRVVARGRVQGVFFRHTARERAEAHGVRGWVRNRDDGAVEALLEGPRQAVERVIRFFDVGPPAASVERVEIEDEEPQGLETFELR
jgi:acylphosphatase